MPKIRNVFGSIDTFTTRKGYVGIDACVRGRVGNDMIQLAMACAVVDPRLMRGFNYYQGEVGGNILLDVIVLAPLAERMLALAKRRRRPASAKQPRRPAAIKLAA